MPDLFTDLTTWLSNMPNRQDLDYSLRKQAAIREWALTQIPVAVGDHVAITHISVSKEGTPGWWTFREALTRGATAIVTDVDFSIHSRGWVAAIILDREWTIHDYPTPGGTRHWRGRATDTPDGYIPPCAYDQEHHPDGRRSVFYVHIDAIERFDTAHIGT